MTKKSIVKTTLAVFSLMMLFNIGAFAQKTDCSKMTEADLVKAIYTRQKMDCENLITPKLQVRSGSKHLSKSYPVF